MGILSNVYYITFIVHLFKKGTTTLFKDYLVKLVGITKVEMAMLIQILRLLKEEDKSKFLEQ